MNNATRRLLQSAPNLLRQVRPGLLAGIVVAVGLATTLVTWKISRDNALAAAQARFDGTASQIVTLVQRRMVAHEQILRGGSALFNMNNDVNRQQWRTYVSSLKLEENYPGILGVGFSRLVPAAEKARHIQAIRAEGFPDYAIRPDTPRDEYNAIVFLEPFWGRNLRAFGFDMGTESVRRQAMDRARDSGEAALSGRVTLVQEATQDVQAGFLLYLPVYKAGWPTATPAERHAALLGYVYSPFRARDLMGSLLAGNFEKDVAVELYAGTAPSPETLLYGRAARGGEHASRFRASTRLEFGGNAWTLRFASLPEFEASFDDRGNTLILGAGTALTLLLALIVWNLIAVRNDAYAREREVAHRLSSSQARFRAVLKSAADGILSIGADGRVESANNAAEHMFGLEDGGARGLRIDELIEGHDIARLESLLADRGLESDTGTVARIECNGMRAGGQQFPIAVSLSRFQLDDSTYYALIVRDITDARFTEAMLKLRERAVESSSNGIVIVDMSFPGQPVIYANPAFERITGYSADEIVGRNCSLLQGDDRNQPGIAELRRAIAEHRSCEVLLRNYRKDGTLFWNELSVAPVTDASGKVTHYVGIQNDITERVAAETNLRIRTQRLDAVFNLSPDGFVAFDARDILTNVNPAFLAMTGLRERDLIGLDAEHFDARLRSLYESGKTYPATLAADGDSAGAPVVLSLVRPQKRIVQRALRVADLSSGEKVVYFRDITRETEVDRLKSEFLSTAAHELRTPLASIFGFSELMLARNYDEGRVKQMIGTIHRQAGVLVKLINELLDLARIEARAGKDFDYRVQRLVPAIEATVDSLLVGNDPRRVAMRIPADLPLVKFDTDKLSLSLTNVLANAYKYSPKGGAIDLEVVTAASGDETLVGIRVRDHGIGMSPEELARVFERFYRADPSGNIPGTGLGMCLVKEIVELHGGRVEVTSEKGVGTTVTLWLPAANAAALDRAA